MKSRTTAGFRQCLKSLPPHIRASAKKAYQLFAENPRHPSLRFKKIHVSGQIYCARVTQDYRALCVITDVDPSGELVGLKVVVWFWIGSHADYDKML